jgi:site-specific recombinase XerD
MTPLRAKYIRDLVIRGRSKHTQEAYIRCVCDLARHYRRSPELISYQEVADWLYHLIRERLLPASSVNVAVSAVRFLYAVTLGRETVDLMASLPHMKRATRRAEVYARSEVEAILTTPRQPREAANRRHCGSRSYVAYPSAQQSQDERYRRRSHARLLCGSFSITCGRSADCPRRPLRATLPL